MLRIAVIEESLPIARGHWSAFTDSVAVGLQQFGHVEVLGHDDGILPSGTPIRKVFRHCYWNNPFRNVPQPLRLGKKLFHSLSWAMDLSAWLSVNEPYDIVYAPNQAPMHLVAWGILRRRAVNQKIKSLGIGINYFGGPEGDPPTSLLGLQSKIGSTLIQRNSRDQTFAYFCEDRRAQQWLTTALKGDFSLVPHAVDIIAAQSLEPTDGKIRFLSLGYARFDKGSDLLAKAVELVNQRSYCSQLEFVLQWGFDSSLPHPEGSQNRANLRLIDESLSGSQCWTLLQQANILILPYRIKDYWARLSRVAVEAVVMGRPVIATKDSSVAELVREHGVLIECHDNSPDSIVDAIEECCNNIVPLMNLAKQKSQAAQIYFSGSTHADMVYRKLIQ